MWYGPFYLEIMLKLPELHLNIYTDLMKEKCIIKANDGIINAVVPDTKLEQTIQRYFLSFDEYKQIETSKIVLAL